MFRFTRKEDQRKLSRMWMRLVKENEITPEWARNFEAFKAGVGSPPDENSKLLRVVSYKPLGPDNFRWS